MNLKNKLLIIVSCLVSAYSFADVDYYIKFLNNTNYTAYITAAAPGGTHGSYLNNCWHITDNDTFNLFPDSGVLDSLPSVYGGGYYPDVPNPELMPYISDEFHNKDIELNSGTLCDHDSNFRTIYIYFSTFNDEINKKLPIKETIVLYNDNGTQTRSIKLMGDKYSAIPYYTSTDTIHITISLNNILNGNVLKDDPNYIKSIVPAPVAEGSIQARFRRNYHVQFKLLKTTFELIVGNKK